MHPLKRYRTANRLSQISVARRLGVTQAMVGRWEKGALITPTRALQIEEAFGIRAETLSKTLSLFNSTKAKRRKERANDQTD